MKIEFKVTSQGPETNESGARTDHAPPTPEPPEPPKPDVSSATSSATSPGRKGMAPVAQTGHLKVVEGAIPLCHLS